MMSKWDTIQEDVKDAYVYLDEEEMYNKALEEGLIEFGSDEYDEDEILKAAVMKYGLN